MKHSEPQPAKMRLEKVDCDEEVTISWIDSYLLAVGHIPPSDDEDWIFVLGSPDRYDIYASMNATCLDLQQIGDFL